MRKLSLLLAFLLLTACGSGSTVTTGGAATNVTPETPVGTLRVSFDPEPDTPRTAAKVITKQVRIVVTNQTLRVNGVIFRAIQDVTPGDSVSFALPMARGYTIEAVTYTIDSDTGLNTILRYAIARSVSVGAEETDATLTLTDVATRFILPPGGVVQNGKYYVQANYSTALGKQATPLHNGWYLVPPKLTSYAGFTNDTSATNYNSTHFFSAPLTGVAGFNLYFQGVFTLKPSLLKNGESQKKWVFNYPSPSFANVSTPVLTPTNFIITTPTF